MLALGFDGVLIIYTLKSECTYRSQNRKIDLQSSIIYHIEIEALEDQKILYRLQEYNDEAGIPRTHAKSFHWLHPVNLSLQTVVD